MTKVQEKKLTIKEKTIKAQEYCSGCLKFDPEEGTCLALKELYPMWGNGDECWSREDDPVMWLKTLNDIQRTFGGSNLTLTQLRWKENLKPEIEKAERLAREATSMEIAEVYKQEKRRGKGGGGEKADRTNKAFGPQQMKDNRMMHRKLNPKKWNGWND